MEQVIWHELNRLLPRFWHLQILYSC